MAGILDAATREFSAKGLHGARIDEIAAATLTSKRLIYSANHRRPRWPSCARRSSR
ncbi:MAG: TetR family transcriptional regulator [Burkholderiales bacterium]